MEDTRTDTSSWFADTLALNTGKMIRVWCFEDAPDFLKALSHHGGDEDWLAYVPPSMKHTYVAWLEQDSGAFGVCDIQELDLYDGGRVFIGAHS